MSEALWGKAMSVRTSNLGEPLTAAALSTDTVLNVADASTFDEVGGLVTINGAQYSYISTDADSDTITLSTATGTALDEQTIIEVYPSSPIKTAYINMGDGGDLLSVTVPHNLLDKLPDGTRDPDAAETVQLEQRGVYEYVILDVTAEGPVTVSLDYVEGEQGIGLSESVAQMQDVQITGEIGASVVSADQIVLDGVNLGDQLALAPLGTELLVSVGGASEIHAGNTSGTTALRLFRLAYGAVAAGRLYEINYTGLLQGSVSGDVFDIKIHYTTDGSDPTASSPIMPFSIHRQGVTGTNASVTVNKTWSWPCPADGELKMAMVINRLSGTGTAYIYLAQEGYGFQWTVKDAGLSATATDPDALSQTAKADGSGSDNPPETTKTIRWYSTRVDVFPGWSGGSVPYISNSNKAIQGWDPVDGSPSDWPGYDPQFSVLTFNYADIISKLSTASSISSCKLTFRVKTRTSASGLDVNVFSHKYTTMPQTLDDWSAEVGIGDIVLAAGSRADCAPGGTYTVELGPTMGGLLKSGARRGFGFYATNYSSTQHGEIYAYPHANRPYLDITFKSP